MSNAIVAKAINDSLGTENFKGLNTILEEQLNSWSELFDEKLQHFDNTMETLGAIADFSYRPSDDIELFKIDVEREGYGSSDVNERIATANIYIEHGGILSITLSKGEIEFDKDVYSSESNMITESIRKGTANFYFQPQTTITIYGIVESESGAEETRYFLSCDAIIRGELVRTRTEIPQVTLL